MSIWIVYVIISPSANRSYVGATVNPSRRLRQHRQELVGGARATKVARDWQYLAQIHGFGTDKRRALRVERQLKRKSSRGRGTPKERRLRGVWQILQEFDCNVDLRALLFDDFGRAIPEGDDDMIDSGNDSGCHDDMNTQDLPNAEEDSSL